MKVLTVFKLSISLFRLICTSSCKIQTCICKSCFSASSAFKLFSKDSSLFNEHKIINPHSFTWLPVKVSLDVLLSQKNWTTIYSSKCYIPKHISMVHIDQNCGTLTRNVTKKSTLLVPIKTQPKVRKLLDNWSNFLISPCIRTFSVICLCM